MVRNTYIYPPAPSMRIVGDIIEHTAKFMPRFNSISISGYHMQEAGATAVQESASHSPTVGVRTLRASRACRSTSSRAGCRSSSAIGMNLFMEVRQAARRAPLVVADHDRSRRADAGFEDAAHTLPDVGRVLTEQDPYNNIVRTAYEALAAVLGGTQSLHTNGSTRRSRCPPTSRRASPATPS